MGLSQIIYPCIQGALIVHYDTGSGYPKLPCPVVPGPTLGQQTKGIIIPHLESEYRSSLDHLMELQSCVKQLFMLARLVLQIFTANIHKVIPPNEHT